MPVNDAEGVIGSGTGGEAAYTEDSGPSPAQGIGSGAGANGTSASGNANDARESNAASTSVQNSSVSENDKNANANTPNDSVNAGSTTSNNDTLTTPTNSRVEATVSASNSRDTDIPLTVADTPEPGTAPAPVHDSNIPGDDKDANETTPSNSDDSGGNTIPLTVTHGPTDVTAPLPADTNDTGSNIPLTVTHGSQGTTEPLPGITENTTDNGNPPVPATAVDEPLAPTSSTQAPQPEAAQPEPEEAAQPSDPAPTALNLGVNDVYRDDIAFAAERTGLPFNVIASVINAEAAVDANGMWNPNSANGKSEARGITQFMPLTWEDQAIRRGTYLNEVAREAGYVDDNNILVDSHKQDLLNLRYDPRVAITAAAEYDYGIFTRLQREGRIPDELDNRSLATFIYIGHHEGPGGARQILPKEGEEPSMTEETAKDLFFNVPASQQSYYLQQHDNDYAQAYIAWLKEYFNKKYLD